MFKGGKLTSECEAIDMEQTISKCVFDRIVDLCFDVACRNNQHATFSRAYVLLKTPEQLVAFAQGYDGHAFRSKDGGGHEFRAVVEFAPSQKVPNSGRATKVDARQGTIEAGEQG